MWQGAGSAFKCDGMVISDVHHDGVQCAGLPRLPPFIFLCRNTYVFAL